MILATRGDDGTRRESPNAINAAKERFMRKFFENRRQRRVVALVLLVLFSATLAASVGCRSGKSSNRMETVDDWMSAPKPKW
ncbi:MAG: hypothetical protein IKU86_01995 [Thermoguttaceae bacterium]|nr:hypothetical protein [Thermoguttaceae bacterium]